MGLTSAVIPLRDSSDIISTILTALAQSTGCWVTMAMMGSQSWCPKVATALGHCSNRTNRFDQSWTDEKRLQREKQRHTCNTLLHR